MIIVYGYLIYLACISLAIFLTNLEGRYDDGEWMEWYWQGYFFIRFAIAGFIVMIPIGLIFVIFMP